MAGRAKHPVDRQKHWNFSDPDGNPVSLEEFLSEQEDAGFGFFEGKEPWLKGHLEAAQRIAVHADSRTTKTV